MELSAPGNGGRLYQPSKLRRRVRAFHLNTHDSADPVSVDRALSGGMLSPFRSSRPEVRHKPRSRGGFLKRVIAAHFNRQPAGVAVRLQEPHRSGDFAFAFPGRCWLPESRMLN